MANGNPSWIAPTYDQPPPGQTTANGRPGSPRKKEKAGIVLARIGPFLGIGIDVVEDTIAVVHIIDHPVDGLHGPFARYVIMEGQHARDIPKR